MNDAAPNRPANVAVIFAGGVGSRMGKAAVPKQFLEIHGKPIIVHTLEHFQNHPDVDAIAIAILPAMRPQLERLVRWYDLTKVRWVVDGGATGQESRHNALKAVADTFGGDTIVLLHDGVRPLIDESLITRNIEAAREHGSAATCTKFNETIASSPSEVIEKIIPRDTIYSAQAPQTFRLDEVLGAYDRAVSEGEHDSIDSVSLMFRYGHEVHRVEGPRSNIKITTAEDFYICRTFFELIENRQVTGI
ncbi:IspD/TarI family cytidylyltransferase [Flexivirga lutea]